MSHQLVLQSQSRVIADTQLPSQFQCRNTILRLRQEKHPQEPGRQRQLRVLEDGATGQRSLSMATVALINPTSSNFTVADVTTLRAYETRWPAPVKQGVVAMLFGAILFEKLWQTESSLKLNLIFGHDALLDWLQVQYAPPRGSIAEPQR